MVIELGKTYEDVITGFTGVALGKVTYLTGCDRVLIVPRCNKEGKVVEGEWFDIVRMKELKNKKKIVFSNTEPPGGDINPDRRY